MISNDLLRFVQNGGDAATKELYINVRKLAITVLIQCGCPIDNIDDLIHDFWLMLTDSTEWGTLGAYKPKVKRRLLDIMVEKKLNDFKLRNYIAMAIKRLFWNRHRDEVRRRQSLEKYMYPGECMTRGFRNA